MAGGAVHPSANTGSVPAEGGGPGVRRARLWRAVAWVLASLVLMGVFAAYLQPAMAFQLAQQLWACF